MQYASPRTDGLAIASLITGILSIVCCVLGIVLGPAAAVMGFISRGRITSSGGTVGGGGLAIGGLVLGVEGGLNEPTNRNDLSNFTPCANPAFACGLTNFRDNWYADSGMIGKIAAFEGSDLER